MAKKGPQRLVLRRHFDIQLLEILRKIFCKPLSQLGLGYFGGSFKIWQEFTKTRKNAVLEQKLKDISGSQRRKYFLPIFGLDRQGYLCEATSHCSWPMPRDWQLAGNGRKSIRAQVSKSAIRVADKLHIFYTILPKKHA